MARGDSEERRGGGEALRESATTFKKLVLLCQHRCCCAYAGTKRGWSGGERGSQGCLTGKYTLLINALLLHVQRGREGGSGAGWMAGWRSKGGFMRPTTGIRSP